MTAKKKASPTFQIVFRIGMQDYVITPLRPHASIALRAYRFAKPDGETYDVRQMADGYCECECQGFLRWRTPCKHIRMLKAAGMFDETPAM